MKKLLIFIILIISIISLWIFTLFFITDKFEIALRITSLNDIFTGINSLYSSLAFAGIIFAIIILAINTNVNRTKLEELTQSHNKHLEIIALSALIQECDSTLHRYDRWEEAGIMGDYMNAKTSVRDKMNTYRENLNKKYEEV